MSKPASKLTRVILGCLCLLGLGLGLFWCGQKRQESRDMQREAERAKSEARLIIVNESSCEWLIAISPVRDEGGWQWKVPVGKTLEVTLPAKAYRIEQKLIADIGAVQTRNFEQTLAAGKFYRWRLASLLSSDAAELAVTLEMEGAR